MEEQIIKEIQESGLRVMASGRTSGDYSYDGTNSSGTGQAELQNTINNNLPQTDPSAALNNILNAAYGIAGVVAVGLIIWAGVSYVTSQGDPGKTKKALQVLIYSLVGLGIVILAAFITNFVIGNVNA